MSNYNSLKATIDANIKQNGNQEITGQILNSVLNAMVTTLGTGYQFAGVVTIATNPGTPDAKVFYIANGKGTYEKFGGLEVTEDDVVVFYWDTAWHKVATGIASQEKLSELDRKAIKLKFMAKSGNLENGEYGYRTDIKKIRYNDNETVVDVPFYDGAIYTYNNELYVWNGTDMVSVVSALKNVVDSLQIAVEKLQAQIKIESGGLETYSPGDVLASSQRARTVDYIPTPFAIELNSGFLTRVVNKYSRNTHQYVSTEMIRVTQYSILNDDGYDYRIAFQKDDDTQTITNSELGTIVKSYKDADKLQLEKTIDDASRRYPSIYVSGLNLSKYPNYASIISDYDAMVAQYPNFISKNTLGQTAQGTPLVEYVLTSGAYNIAGLRGTRDTQIAKNKMLLMTGVHGYEPGSVMSTLTMVREYIGGNSVLSKLRNLELHIVPCVNPDGYNAGTRYNANGVDINRNFNENWQLSGEGTAYYSGPSAASENETQIIQDWIDNNTDALFVIDFHQSSFNNEMACLGYTVLYTTPGEDAFKKRFLLSMRNIANLLIKERGVAYDSIFGYTYNEPVTMHGLSNGYIAKKGLPGGCLEVPENVANSGVNSVKTIAVGADIIGNLLLGWYELYK